MILTMTESRFLGLRSGVQSKMTCCFITGSNLATSSTSLRRLPLSGLFNVSVDPRKARIFSAKDWIIATNRCKTSHHLFLSASTVPSPVYLLSALFLNGPRYEIQLYFSIPYLSLSIFVSRPKPVGSLCPIADLVGRHWTWHRRSIITTVNARFTSSSKMEFTCAPADYAHSNAFHFKTPDSCYKKLRWNL